jgi:hypothetical protein
MHWRWLLIASIAGLLLGNVVMGAIAYTSMRYRTAVIISKVSIKAEAVYGYNGVRELRVEYSGYHDEGCPDTVSHLLIHGQGDDEVDYPLLPLTINMLTQLGGQHRLTVPFLIPDNVPPGLYNYVGMATDQCEFLPGLSRPTPRRTVPVSVDVPPVTAVSPNDVPP